MKPLKSKSFEFDKKYGRVRIRKKRIRRKQRLENNTHPSTNQNRMFIKQWQHYPTSGTVPCLISLRMMIVLMEWRSTRMDYSNISDISKWYLSMVNIGMMMIQLIYMLISEWHINVSKEKKYMPSQMEAPIHAFWETWLN